MKDKGEGRRIGKEGGGGEKERGEGEEKERR